VQIVFIISAAYVVVLGVMLFRITKGRSKVKKISGRGGDFN
jgi:hypothetical protein